MKSLFFEFDYFLNEQKLSELWLDPETLFVLDTNVLLNLYSYQDATRKAIYKSLDKVNDRLWVPHQVMLEFHKNRPEIIYKSKKNFDLIVGHLDAFIEAHKCNEKELITFDTNFGKMYPELRGLFTNFKESSQTKINELILQLEEEAKPIKEKAKELKKQTISLTGTDHIYQKLLEFYSDEKVGLPFDQEALDKIYEEGAVRYVNEIPPGYKDGHKTEEFLNRGVLYKSKFGDLILYKQILKFSLDTKIKNVIFISEDSKKDWKESVPHENNKYYGVRREIREEAFKEAGILNFLVFNTEEFIKHSKVKLDNSLVADLNAVHEKYINISKFVDHVVTENNHNNIHGLDEEIINLERDITVLSAQIEQLKFEAKHLNIELNSTQEEIKVFERRIVEDFENLEDFELHKQHLMLRDLNMSKKILLDNLDQLERQSRELSKQRFFFRKKLDKLLTIKHNELKGLDNLIEDVQENLRFINSRSSSEMRETTPENMNIRRARSSSEMRETTPENMNIRRARSSSEMRETTPENMNIRRTRLSSEMRESTPENMNIRRARSSSEMRETTPENMNIRRARSSSEMRETTPENMNIRRNKTAIDRENSNDENSD